MRFQPILKYGIVLLLTVAFGGAVTLFGNHLVSLNTQIKEKIDSENNIAYSDAYLNFGDQVAQKKIFRGRPFFVHYKAIRPGICNAEMVTTMTNVVTHVSAVLRSVESWYAQGNVEINEMYELPTGLPKGDYAVTKKAITHCNSVTSYSIIFNLDAVVSDVSAPVVATHKPTMAPPVPVTTGNTVIKKPEETSFWYWKWKGETHNYYDDPYKNGK